MQMPIASPSRRATVSFCAEGACPIADASDGTIRPHSRLHKRLTTLKSIAKEHALRYWSAGSSSLHISTALAAMMQKSSEQKQERHGPIMLRLSVRESCPIAVKMMLPTKNSAADAMMRRACLRESCLTTAEMTKSSTARPRKSVFSMEKLLETICPDDSA